VSLDARGFFFVSAFHRYTTMPTNEEVTRAMTANALKLATKTNPHDRHLHIEGGLIGTPKDTNFDQRYPHSFCYMCGAVFQSDLDRVDNPNFKTRYNADSLRSIWRHKHSDSHPMQDHIEYRAAGRLFTPQAIQRLSTYGIYPVSDQVFSEEHEQAAATAPRFDNNINDDVEREVRSAVL